ncbi:MAG: LPS export ABC transporter ATP-binding protein, partial [Candidatus Lightella neohaematopini]|nr:LPS export ABC transporter ATP-binding protein [Candidatus Lightella neohaematopini]
MSYLIVKNLSKKYNNTLIVNNVNLYFDSKKIIGILGPNGSGKTTIFYMIIGIIKNNYGDILIDNININKFSIHKRIYYGINFLPQKTSIFRNLSVFDNIMIVLENKKNLSYKKRTKLVLSLVKKFNIEHLINNMGYTLSGGECRKVEIARTIATNPKFILFDEPFLGIDPISILKIKNIIKQLNNNGLGIIITDHNTKEIFDICEELYILYNGKVIANGTSKEIKSNKKVKS